MSGNILADSKCLMIDTYLLRGSRPDDWRLIAQLHRACKLRYRWTIRNHRQVFHHEMLCPLLLVYGLLLACREFDRAAGTAGPCLVDMTTCRSSIPQRMKRGHRQAD